MSLFSFSYKNIGPRVISVIKNILPYIFLNGCRLIWYV